MPKYRVKFAVIVDVDSDWNVDIRDNAIYLLDQGYGQFEYEEA